MEVFCGIDWAEDHHDIALVGRDGLFGAVAVLGEQLQQPGQAGRVVADPRPGQQLPVAVHQGDVVVVFGPVDPAECVQVDPPSP